MPPQCGGARCQMTIDERYGTAERAINLSPKTEIAAAVKAEREACAAIADDAAMFLSVHGKGAWAGVAKAIADEIRKRAR